MFRKIALLTDLSNSESADNKSFNLIGQTGITMTALRPSGKVIICDEVYDAVSNQDYIEREKTVVVTKFENMQLYVEENV
jgi:membrane-bound serine protease (ClpP class)